MIHELRFTDTYQPGVMFAYMGPHAGDPELNAAIEEEVHDLQAILNSEHARALDVNSIGNIVTFKGSRLQILLESSVPTNGSLPRDDAMTVYGEADGCLWTPLWDGLGKKPPCPVVAGTPTPCSRCSRGCLRRRPSTAHTLVYRSSRARLSKALPGTRARPVDLLEMTCRRW